MCGGRLWENGSNKNRTMAWCHFSKDCQQIEFVDYYCSLYGDIWNDYLAEPDMVLVFGIYHVVFGDGTRLAMPKTICAPDSSLKPGSGATEGVLDYGVSGWPY